MNTESKIQNIDIDKIGIPFVQFIIAINGTLIGYSLKHIENKTFSFTLIPLGLSIIFWCISFFLGITSIRKIISVRILDVFKDSFFVKVNSEYTKKTNEQIKLIGDKANNFNKHMYTFLYLGVFSYLVWQGTEMYYRTIEIHPKTHLNKK